LRRASCPRVCVGLNYRDHAEEQRTPLPERPLLVAKWPNTIIGPDDSIVVPAIIEGFWARSA
jgi:2-keto-4-pentenoate hydratase/2-oxohepta-3-ene-1,7-dioic acid hydratase in catechol pathway